MARGECPRGGIVGGGTNRGEGSHRHILMGGGTGEGAK